MRGRSFTLMLALVTGGLAAAVVFLYVRDVEDKTTQGLQTRPVLVATQHLPAGTTGGQIHEAGAYELKNLPIRYAAPGVLGSPQELLPEATLADDIAAGEQLTEQRFRADAQNAFLSQLPPGTEALSLPLEHVRGVSGRLTPGDRINAYVTSSDLPVMLTTTGKLRKLVKKAVKDPESIVGIPRVLDIPDGVKVFSSEGNAVTFKLANIPIVEVVGLATAAPAPAGPPAPPAMTLAVTPAQAAWLVYSHEKAKVWYTLGAHDVTRTADR